MFVRSGDDGRLVEEQVWLGFIDCLVVSASGSDVSAHRMVTSSDVVLRTLKFIFRLVSVQILRIDTRCGVISWKLKAPVYLSCVHVRVFV
jgi:hypothetical protein